MDCTWIACSPPGTSTCPASAWGRSLPSTSAGSQISSSLGELSHNLRLSTEVYQQSFKIHPNPSELICMNLCDPSQRSSRQRHSQPSFSAPRATPLIILIAKPPSRLQCEEEVKIKILISSKLSPQNIFSNRRTPPPQPLDNTEEQSSPLPHEVIYFLKQIRCYLTFLTYNFINNLTLLHCRPQMSILCSLWTKALRKNRTTSWTPQKWTMKSRWKRAMFKKRRGRGRASAVPSVTSAGRNLKIRSPHQHNSPCFRLELSANSLNRHVRRVHEVTLSIDRVFYRFSKFRRNLLVLHVWLARLDFHD